MRYLSDFFKSDFFTGGYWFPIALIVCFVIIGYVCSFSGERDAGYRCNHLITEKSSIDTTITIGDKKYLILYDGEKIKVYPLDIKEGP